MRDLADSKSGRINPVYAGSDQFVAFLDVDIDRQVGQIDSGIAAIAESDGAQAAAFHLNGDCQVLVDDQRDFAAEWIHLGDLADDAQFVDHGLAGGNAVSRAKVDDHFLGERVASAMHDFA